MHEDARHKTGARRAPEDVKTLLRAAGRRPRLPEDEVEPIRVAVRASWQRQVRRTWRKRVIGVAATLAASLLLVSGLVWLGPRLSTPPTVGILELQTGEVIVSGAHGTPLALGPGTVISTGSSSRAAVRLVSDSSLRIDVQSVVRFESPEVFGLDRGAVYFDSGPGPRDEMIEVVTPLGKIRHLGTQFEVRLLREQEREGGVESTALRVRVREGAVLVLRGGASHRVDRGDEIIWFRGGEIRRADAPVHGTLWEWTQRPAPPLDIEGASLVRFLEWVSRETGLVWKYAEPDMAGAAEAIILHGSIEGLTPEEAISIVLPGCGFSYQRLEGELLLLRDAGA